MRKLLVADSLRDGRGLSTPSVHLQCAPEVGLGQRSSGNAQLKREKCVSGPPGIRVSLICFAQIDTHAEGVPAFGGPLWRIAAPFDGWSGKSR